MAFAIVVAVLAGSLFYTPDYLHLTVVPDKRRRWAIKIRSRIIIAVLLLGLTLAPNAHGRIATVIAALWLTFTMLLARRLNPRWLPLFLFFTDWLLVMPSILHGGLSGRVAIAILALAVHLAVVICARRYWKCAVLSGAAACFLLVMVWGHGLLHPFPWAGWTMIAISALFTAYTVHRAEKHNAGNIEHAMAELTEFTGYHPEKIRALWETSNQQLAANWEKAAIPHDDRERMAEWYRQNSELYLFAISAYNLEFKRIKSNLKVLRFARGACLDYGAGNGEILLEWSRRGNIATYFDVDGVTMRFARHRAERQKLPLEFATTKDALRAAAARHGFDTVFSFDVLEHLPDLPGELDFLSSLLSPGGVFVFDVPAGSTKAHPMHLNHNLNVLEYMSAKQLVDRRPLSLRIPFRKEEKWIFEKPKS
jgi:2-polyprenyl-3-methyl-5-hydroxy-6-metoxy-1,4-benzoquinol methylase